MDEEGGEELLRLQESHIGGSADEIHCPWCVTAASTHDSKMLMEVLSDDEQGDRQVWADSAYRSESAIQELTALGYKPRINHKGTRTKSLNARQKQ